MAEQVPAPSAEPGAPTSATGPAGVTLQISATPVVSAAMIGNRVSVVSRVVLRNDGPALTGVNLQLTVRDAQGPLSPTWTRTLDLPAGTEIVLDDVDLFLDAAAMARVLEPHPGDVLAVLARDTATSTELLAAEEIELLVLPANHWSARPLPLGLELLAAHVQPDHPAIADLVDGIPTTGGPDEIARAVFDAMARRKIRSSPLASSWTGDSQKIRNPHEVLVDGVGTCLDLAVTMAAALERAGVAALIWLTEAHAFLGYWREGPDGPAGPGGPGGPGGPNGLAPDGLGPAVTDPDDVVRLVNLVDLGAIGLVETTMLADAGEWVIQFDRSAEPPYARFLAGDLGQILGVRDLRAPRQRPTRRSTPITRATSPTAKTAPPRVELWKNALLDLSLRNRLINYTGRSGISLAVPGHSLADLEDLVSGQRKLTLLPADEIDPAEQNPQHQRDQLQKRNAYTDVAQAGYATKLRGLAYRARTLIEETGSNNLYLALGSLSWTLDDRPLRSPLILLPVRLRKQPLTGRYPQAERYRLELDESGASTPNFCLLEKLRLTHNLVVPELAEPAPDQAGIDLDAALRALRQALLDADLPFRVQETADLSILQFAKFRLWKDLDEGWPTLTANPLVSHLVHAPSAAFADPAPILTAPDLDELGARCPSPADASQLTAIADAVAGRTFVLEGPPGTGKSQTITNLLTEAIRQGRRVLFVAEKRAALDVVRDRLKAAGMDAFALNLHDKGSKPATVRAQIQAAMAHIVTVDEPHLAANEADLRSARTQLCDYAHALHNPNPTGLSFYTARSQQLALAPPNSPTLATPTSELPIPVALLTTPRTAHDPARLRDSEAVRRIRKTLETLPTIADLARPTPDHPWGFVARTDPRTLDVGAIRAAVEAVNQALTQLPGTGVLAEAVLAARSPDDLITLSNLLDAGLPLKVLDQTRSAAWRQAVATLTQKLTEFAAASHPGLNYVTPSVLDLPLDEIHRQAQAAASSSWFGRKKRLRAVAGQLAPALRPGAEIPLKQLVEVLADLLKAQAQAWRITTATALAGVRLAATWNPLIPDDVADLNRQLTHLTEAGQAVDPAPTPVVIMHGSVPVLSVQPPSSGAGMPGFVTALRAALGAGTPAGGTESCMITGEGLGVLGELGGTTRAGFEAWAAQRGLVGQWRATASGRDLADPQLPSLRHWVALLEHLAPLTECGLHEARQLLLTGQVQARDARAAFDLGLANASLQERAATTGLDRFDPPAQQRAIDQFVTAGAAVRQEMTKAAALEVIRRRSLDVDSDRGQVGALRHELGKQRGGLRVRSLIEKYGDLITQLMPCVLVSPDSLARFFPVEGARFDLVVFDEASQIRVADAVGAMGRARAVVVVGDSKQMPPTAFAEPASDEPAPDETVSDEPAGEDGEQDEQAPVDEESILSECVTAQVPRHWLTWHYRSQDESLIAFSNQRYYEGKLSSFPAPPTGKSDPGPGGRGISLVRIGGHFHRSGEGKLLRTNPAEAEAVVADIRRRFDAAQAEPGGATPSIGVITFNQQQRSYVEALIRDGGDQRLAEALDAADEEGLFVKNLENVQGDERDVILFSTAFSPNARGVLPLNFGPLNRDGGERRLNVAITRARCQVVVFSSFDPAQLRAEETSSVGIKHLQAYLELAAGGPAVLAPAGGRRAVLDRHRDQIAARLRERGIEVRTDVGLSEFRLDLTLARPGRPPTVAVLLDGPEWAARQTVSDRDGLPVDVLRRMMGWPAVERVWMPAWLQDPSSILDHLQKVLQDARPRPVVPVAPAVKTESSQEAPPEPLPQPSKDRKLAGQINFQPWVPQPLGSRSVLARLPDPKATHKVQEALIAGANAEGPIHLDRLARAVAAGYDLTRLSEARLAAIRAAIPADLIRDAAEPFAWPVGVDPQQWNEFRSSPDGQRPLEAISRREIGNAMVALCLSSGGMRPTELKRETLTLFGGKRVTEALGARLTQSLDQCIGQQRLARQANGLIMVV